VLGLLTVAGGLWQVSTATVSTDYAGMLPGMILLGVGAGLVIPTATGSVMGSLPDEHTGVGAATNGTFLQVGGALGVAVIGSLLSTRYDDRVSAALRKSPVPVPDEYRERILGSLGGALGVAARLPAALGEGLAHAARSAFISGMGLGMLAAAIVAGCGALLAMLAFPARRRQRRSR
jgi:hypothetical protein